MFRKMRRYKQQLSDEQCVEILRSEKRGVLALCGDGGYPYAVPLNFVYDEGKLWFHSAVEGHKIDAVNACEKASFCITSKQELSDDGWSYYFESVIVFGKISIVTDEAKRIEKLRKLGTKFYQNPADVEEELRKSASRAAVLELDIEHMTGKRVREK